MMPKQQSRISMAKIGLATMVSSLLFSSTTPLPVYVVVDEAPGDEQVLAAVQKSDAVPSSASTSTPRASDWWNIYRRVDYIEDVMFTKMDAKEMAALQRKENLEMAQKIEKKMEEMEERTVKRADETAAKNEVQHKEDLKRADEMEKRTIFMFITSSAISSIAVFASYGKGGNSV